MVEIKDETHVRYGYYDEYGYFQLHNENGPAVIYSDGSKYWFNHNTVHREDGPAIIDPISGMCVWYANGKVVTGAVKKWLNERNIDENNMSDEDKMALQFFMRSL